ncbi:autotransporter outer membrane beta-barrel domain-containing protein [Roseinatronobacter alkalisoli]|uniref:Autotransporter outer membrane beta-barrel domain-containing protein n=1 Tax=Roseinatronobacter alkalisoli TaxID=3028235 RepID=A0ABT5TDR5_9RHOB|nr:autotransporter outer membrane beta-barrel domain-containing protein [Roseinatronobacter sp. HJB301]MDD7973255.1 autotransporter outer membrane beta-barrel domain-containing protein [Roseinatronobacter sp. HJB301]
MTVTAAAAFSTSLAQPVQAQDTTLIAAFHQNFDFSSTTFLNIFGEPGTEGTITNNAGFSQAFTIDAGGAFQLDLDLADSIIPLDGSVQDNAFFVTANSPISALATNLATASSDMTSLLSTNALGSEYFVLGWEQLGANLSSQLSITAVEDNTEVNFTPKNPLSGFAADEAHTVTLNAGETLGLTGFDVTGTYINASAPVAVFGGVQCGNIPQGVSACDHVISQNVGVENFSDDFRMIQTPLAGSDADLIRVIAASDNTEISIDGVLQGTINRGEFLTIDNVGNAHITASNPVQLGQYMRGESGSRSLGDPAFSVLPGTDQWINSYVFSIPGDGTTPDFERNYLMVVISEQAEGSLLLNDVLVEQTDYDEREILDGFVYGTIELAEAGVGTVSADEDFLAMIAGFDNFDSYLTTIATRFDAGASPGPGPTPTPAALPTAPAYEVLPRLMANLAHTGSLRQRIGNRLGGTPVDGNVTLSSSNDPNAPSMTQAGSEHGVIWLSTSFERLRPRSGDFALADQVRQSINGIKFGYDLPSIRMDSGNLVLGAFVEYQRGNSRVESTIFNSSHSISSTARGLGASLTWYGHGGTYVDVVGRHMWLRNNIDFLDENQRGSASSLSFEVGHEIDMGNNWRVTPQMQLSYASVRLNDITGPLGEEVSFRSMDSVRARIGAEVDYYFQTATGASGSVFLSANLINDVSFSPKIDVTAGNQTTTYAPSGSRTLAEIGAGGQIALNDKSYMNGGVFVSRNIGSGGGTNVRGQLGLNFNW